MKLITKPLQAVVSSLVPRRILPAQKVGLAPGSAVFVGTQKVEQVELSTIEYDEQSLNEQPLEHVDALQRRDDTKLWLDVVGLHDVPTIETVGQRFGLHALTVEDVLSVGQHPKFEEYEEQIYLVARMLTYENDSKSMDDEQVSIVFGRDFLLSFQERHGDVFEMVRKRLRGGKGRLRRMQPDYLAYCLVDAIVDQYFVIIDMIMSEIDQLEEAQLSNPMPEHVRKNFELREKFVVLRQALMPVRDMAAAMLKSDHSLIQDELSPFLRDLIDHVMQALANVEMGREHLSGLLDFYHTQLNQRMNDVMRVLTIIGTIFIPLTFLAGIYGMNFEYMPELQWRWGYPVLLGVMATLGIGLIILFRRRNWL